MHSKSAPQPDSLRVVIDEQDDCPYLPGEIARMPLCIPTESISSDRMEQLLELGYRRSGAFFYRTQCPRCDECKPLRLDIHQFSPSRSQRRVLKKGDSNLTIQLNVPTVDRERVELFNLHRQERGLDHGNKSIDATDYRAFLLNAPCESVELSLWHMGKLVAVSITDVASHSLSAVYCFFDPTFFSSKPRYVTQF